MHHCPLHGLYNTHSRSHQAACVLWLHQGWMRPAVGKPQSTVFQLFFSLGLIPGMKTWIWRIPIDIIYGTQKNWMKNLVVLLFLNCYIVLMINLEKNVQSANLGRGTHGCFLIHSNFTVFLFYTFMKALILPSDENSCYVKEWILNLNIYATGMKEGSYLNVVYDYENLSCMRGGQQGVQASICSATLLPAALWRSPFIPSNLHLLNIGFLQQRKGRWLL